MTQIITTSPATVPEAIHALPAPILLHEPATSPPATGPPCPQTLAPGTHVANPQPATRTGPLRSGNPRGNPNLAPRCGAKARTTGCPCHAPAMPNGRCRMHGGKSTGPRTACTPSAGPTPSCAPCSVTPGL